MLRWMKDNWKVVRAVIRPHASTFVFLLFVQLISVCLAVLIPLLNMELIDLFVYEKMGMLASGEINHSETGENSQFQSDRKSQYTSFSFL